MTIESLFSSQQLLNYHLFCSIWMTSLIWVIQLVHYPFFQFVSEQNKQKASVFHTSRIFWCVFPFMIIEIASWTGYLLLSFNTKPETVLITLLLTGIWLITFFVQVPQHQQMAQSYDINFIQKLVNKNWIRTIFWTLKLIILILFIN